MENGLLVDAIYEAGAMPERWPSLLTRVADLVGARGGVLFRSSEADRQRIVSSGIADVVAEWDAGDWNRVNTRVSRAVARPPYAGFLTDADLHTPVELRTLPIFRDFLIPRGLGVGAGTLIQGAGYDRLMLTIEGLACHASAPAAISKLDALRPHLARAAVLSAQMRLRCVQFAVDALAAIDVPAAMLDGKGRILALNATFEALTNGCVRDGAERMRLRDPVQDKSFASALARLLREGVGSSIGFKQKATSPPAAMHLVPLCGEARDVFLGTSAIVLIAEGAGAAIPDGAVLQSLFDLTPAEARIACGLAGGRSLQRIADEHGVSINTVRTQVQHVLQKTHTARQGELVGLLGRLAHPTQCRP